MPDEALVKPIDVLNQRRRFHSRPSSAAFPTAALQKHARERDGACGCAGAAYGMLSVPLSASSSITGSNLETIMICPVCGRGPRGLETLTHTAEHRDFSVTVHLSGRGSNTRRLLLYTHISNAPNATDKVVRSSPCRDPVLPSA